ncbi:MAG: S9 family peptidase [Haloferacaceae archaeon]
MQSIQAADYHDIAKPAQPRLSPDGERVAFVRKVPDDEESYEATVYVVPTDGSAPARRFSLAEGVDAEPRWSPSGDRLAFTSTRGADDDRQQLWVLPVEGGEARQVTDVVGGVRGITWSPDGSRIAFVQSVTAEDREEGRDRGVEEEYEPETPDPRVVDRTVFRSMQEYFDGRRSHVYVVDVNEESGDVAGDDHGNGDERGGGGDDAITPITPSIAGDADFDAPEWGDARTLYFTQSVGEDPDDSLEYGILARDTETGETRRLHRTTGWGAQLAATADGAVAFAHIEPEQATLQQVDLHVIDAGQAADADGPEDVEVVDVTAGLDRTLGYEATPQWGPDDATLYFATPDEGKTSVWAVPGDGSDDPSRLVREGSVSGMDVGASPDVDADVDGDADADVDGDADADVDGGADQVAVAVAMSQWDHPGDVFASVGGTADGAATARERDLVRLTALNEAYLESVRVGEPERLDIESERGAVDGWVLTPPEFDPAGTYPLAVEVHGGPHAMWSTSGTMWHEFQTLAARGYVVFWSNPRGSAGYGEEYMQAIERAWGEVTLSDVMAGVREVADREYVDEENVFLTGGSFGGFMTGWTVGQTDYFRAAVSQRGVYHLAGFYGSTDNAYKLVEGDFDTTPWEEPEFLWEQSPVGHAHEVDTPTLVIHSEDDYRTPISDAELFHRILRKNDVETRFVRYPREGHELSRSGEPGHVVDRIERIARWFDGYSDHHDVPTALERGQEGLSAAENEEDEES